MLAFLILRSLARSLTGICYQCLADVCEERPIIRPSPAERMTARPDRVYAHACMYMYAASELW